MGCDPDGLDHPFTGHADVLAHALDSSARRGVEQAQNEVVGPGDTELPERPSVAPRFGSRARDRQLKLAFGHPGQKHLAVRAWCKPLAPVSQACPKVSQPLDAGGSEEETLRGDGREPPRVPDSRSARCSGGRDVGPSWSTESSVLCWRCSCSIANRVVSRERLVSELFAGQSSTRPITRFVIRFRGCGRRLCAGRGTGRAWLHGARLPVARRARRARPRALRAARRGRPRIGASGESERACGRSRRRAVCGGARRCRGGAFDFAHRDRRLEELRLAAVEDRIDAELALGRSSRARLGARGARRGASASGAFHGQ